MAIHSEREQAATPPAMAPWQYGATLLLGVFFGLVLYKSEVIRWERINAMFRFEEPHMYIVIVMAIATAAPAMWFIRRHGRSVTGEKLVIKDPPYQRGVIYGGLIFGVGWAITAACPGPIYAQFASGEYAAAATFVGAMGGMYAYAYLEPRLPH